MINEFSLEITIDDGTTQQSYVIHDHMESIILTLEAIPRIHVEDRLLVIDLRCQYLITKAKNVLDEIRFNNARDDMQTYMLEIISSSIFDLLNVRDMCAALPEGEITMERLDDE